MPRFKINRRSTVWVSAFIAALLIDNCTINPQNGLSRVKRDIPLETSGAHKGDTSRYYTFLKNEMRLLRLPDLETGFDSLQIRIRLGHSMAVKKNVVVLAYTDGRWHGKLITYTDAEDTETSKSFASGDVQPKSGWNDFAARLLNERITELPHAGTLQYSGCGGADGITYYFEIATAGTYRFYYYCNLKEGVGHHPEMRHVQRIVDLLEKELDFTYTK